MKKFIKPAHDDPHNSWDLFDADRRNEFGGMYCIAPAILYSEVAWHWNRYVASQKAVNNN